MLQNSSILSTHLYGPTRSLYVHLAQTVIHTPRFKGPEIRDTLSFHLYVTTHLSHTVIHTLCPEGPEIRDAFPPIYMRPFKSDKLLLFHLQMQSFFYRLMSFLLILYSPMENTISPH